MTELNLYQKLIEIRKKVKYLKKDAEGYKYSYVSGASILGELREEMDKQKVLLVPNILEYITSYEKKSMVSCKMIMTWINADKPSEKLEVPFACFGAQDDISKAFGSALTYTERYFMLKFFNIPTDKDDPDSFQKKNNNYKSRKIDINLNEQLDLITAINEIVNRNHLQDKLSNALIKRNIPTLDRLSSIELKKWYARFVELENNEEK